MQIKQRCKARTVLAAALAAVALAGHAQTAKAPASAPQAAARIGQTPARAESVERLLKAMEVEKIIQSSYADMAPMAGNMAQQAGLPQENRAAFDRYMQRTSTIMSEEMSWDQMKAPMVQIYMKHYSEEEVRGLTEFYESPLGRRMVANTPAVTREVALATQQAMGRVMPRLMEAQKELQRELRPSQRTPAR